ncbi:MAG: hypothetical protein CMB82_11710 [Flammeovirgaceae bacterium]|nr:hypothetical protein [Flammeovirgaceae bacterium]
MKISFYNLYIIIFCILTSCIDPVQLDVAGEDKFLVIVGEITNFEESYKVRIFESAQQKSGKINLTNPISNAEVKIWSQDGENVILNEDEPGQYMSKLGELVGQTGKQYYLEVKLSDGKEYRSTPEYIDQATPISNVSFEFVPEEQLNQFENIIIKNMLKVFVDVELIENREETFLKWEVNGEYQFNEYRFPGPDVVNRTCYVLDNLPLGDVEILKASSNDQIDISKIEIKSVKVNHKFASNYCFHIRQETLSLGAYDYWGKIKKITESEGSLFENPFGRVKGNIRNVNDSNDEVMGYFSASGIAMEKAFVPSEIVNNPKSPCPTYRDPILGPACRDCLTLKKSSLIKPAYWP